VCLSITKVILEQTRSLWSIVIQLGVEIELSSYIHPPFKIAMSWSNGLCMKDVVKLHMSDVSQSPRVFAMEFHCQFWYRDFRGGFPRIVFAAISFPLDEILESCYESPKKKVISHTFEHLIHNIKTHNGVKI